MTEFLEAIPGLWPLPKHKKEQEVALVPTVSLILSTHIIRAFNSTNY